MDAPRIAIAKIAWTGLVRTNCAAGVAMLFFAAQLSCTAAVMAQDSDALVMETDSVTISREGERTRTLKGSIQDIAGDSLLLRRTGRTDVQVLRLSDVSGMTFIRSEVFESGLLSLQQQKYADAIRQFDQALEIENRSWAKNELLAFSARAHIKQGQRDAAVRQIERILETDNRSRHTWLLPLVWDARLPPEERVSAAASDLADKSPVRQLVAASALLDDDRHRQAAVKTLQRLKKATTGPLSDIAAIQLWRLNLLSDVQNFATVLEDRQRRVDAMSADARGAPQYVLARCFQQMHDTDRASIGFLWMPLMRPIDDALAAMSMAEAIRCLTASGRIPAADSLTAELQRRFPGASATKVIQTQTTDVSK